MSIVYFPIISDSSLPFGIVVASYCFARVFFTFLRTCTGLFPCFLFLKTFLFLLWTLYAVPNTTLNTLPVIRLPKTHRPLGMLICIVFIVHSMPLRVFRATSITRFRVFLGTIIDGLNKNFKTFYSMLTEVFKVLFQRIVCE